MIGFLAIRRLDDDCSLSNMILPLLIIDMDFSHDLLSLGFELFESLFSSYVFPNVSYIQWVVKLLLWLFFGRTYPQTLHFHPGSSRVGMRLGWTLRQPGQSIPSFSLRSFIYSLCSLKLSPISPMMSFPYIWRGTVSLTLSVSSSGSVLYSIALTRDKHSILRVRVNTYFQLFIRSVKESYYTLVTLVVDLNSGIKIRSPVFIAFLTLQNYVESRVTICKS